MKIIIKAFIFIAVVAVYSCEHYDGAYPDLSENSPAYVELSSTAALTVPEGGVINITLSSRTVIYDAYTVSYELTGDYKASGSIEVPEGVNSVTVQIPVDAGIVEADALEATFTLTSATGDVVVGRGGANVSVDVTITKFIPFVNTDYAITFDCEEPGYATYPATFVTTADPLVLTNTNFWDSGWEIDYTFSGDFDQTVTIESQTVDSGGDIRIVSGSGSYDGVTKTMVVNYTVTDDSGGVLDDNTHTFTVPAR